MNELPSPKLYKGHIPTVVGLSLLLIGIIIICNNEILQGVFITLLTTIAFTGVGFLIYRPTFIVAFYRYKNGVINLVIRSKKPVVNFKSLTVFLSFKDVTGGYGEKLKPHEEILEEYKEEPIVGLDFKDVLPIKDLKNYLEAKCITDFEELRVRVVANDAFTGIQGIGVFKTSYKDIVQFLKSTDIVLLFKECR